MPDLALQDIVPHLLRPEWLYALLPLVLLLPWLYRRNATEDPWRRVIDPHLLAHLHAGSDLPRPVWQRAGARLSLLAVLWAVAVLALCGPSWQRSPAPLHRPGGALVVLLDLSLSMYAADVTPDRIARARQEVTDLVQQFSGGRTALIAYAGDAHIVTPFTDDTRTLTNLLASLEPAIMPVPGSDLAAALQLAQTLIKGGDETQGSVVVVTDEVVNAADLTVFDHEHFPISILGVGTAQGGPIPISFDNAPPRNLTDAQGTTVIARLDPERLAEVARQGNGVYVTARADDADTRLLLANAPGSAMDAKGNEDATSDATSQVLQWQDQGYWLVLLLLPFCAYAFRRGVLVRADVFVLLLVGCVLAPSPVHAADAPTARGNAWADLWWRRDQQGMQALTRGRPDEAANLFTSPQWRATALYRSNKHDAAARLFRQDPSADGQYNLGNALAKSGHFKQALDAYARALQLNPNHADARFNQALLQRRQRARQQQSSAHDGSQQRQGGEQSSAQQQSKSTPSQQGRQSERPNEQPSERPQTRQPERAIGEQSERNAGQQPEQRTAQQNTRPQENPEQRDQATRSPTSDEQRRATEQWLRRVPDRPGALLRNKFEMETSQRMFNGEQPSVSERPW